MVSFEVQRSALLVSIFGKALFICTDRKSLHSLSGLCDSSHFSPFLTSIVDTVDHGPKIRRSERIFTHYASYQCLANLMLFSTRCCRVPPRQSLESALTVGLLNRCVTKSVANGLFISATMTPRHSESTLLVSRLRSLPAFFAAFFSRLSTVVKTTHSPFSSRIAHTGLGVGPSDLYQGQVVLCSLFLSSL